MIVNKQNKSILISAANKALNPEILKRNLLHRAIQSLSLCDHKDIRMSFNSTCYTQNLRNAIWL